MNALLKKNPIYIFLLWLLCLFPFVLRAENTMADLDAFFHDLKTLQADFSQKVTDANEMTIQKSTGTLYLSRPGKFFWHYQQPFEQKIISDGKRLFIYDIDLEQVTIQRVNETLSQTPAVLLVGDTKLDSIFTITESDKKQGLDWLSLTAKSNDTNFKTILLGMNKQNIQKMMLTDYFGQTTEITFTNISRNPKLKPELFIFTAPENVDVISNMNES